MILFVENIKVFLILHDINGRSLYRISIVKKYKENKLKFEKN